MKGAGLARRPIVATERERKAIGAIASVLDRAKPGKAQLVSPDGRHTIIPHSLYELLHQAVRQLAQGNGVTILPVTAELTTQQAANLLQVSRPFVISLMEAGRIPFHLIGTHRRVYLRDLLLYRDTRDESSRKALDRLVAEAQDLGIYDE